MTGYSPINLGGLRTHSLYGRPSKVKVEDFAAVPIPGVSFQGFWQALPRILFGEDIRTAVSAIVTAHSRKSPVVLAMGAHVIKCGLSPVIIELIKKGVITAIALNGAGPIHDVEIALAGYTSEDVEAGLPDGSFGMASETGELINRALEGVKSSDFGLGLAIGRELLKVRPPYLEYSLMAMAAEQGIPATVHVAIGTDIVHMRGEADGAAIGAASFTDFRLFTSVICNLTGGVYINAGSAVVLPEVFLKAFNIARNFGADLRDFTTINIDIAPHYRPAVNVIKRPSMAGGKGIFLEGRHELLLPLIAYAVLNDLSGMEVA